MEKLPEGTLTSNNTLAHADTSERLQATPAKQHNRSGEGPAAERSNRPPRKKEKEALVLKHYRLRAIDVGQTEAISTQRGSDLSDTARKQYERGVNVDTALGAPSEDGLYGLYQGQRLAELLRADIDGLISFALNHGVVPTMLQEYRRVILTLNETIQNLRIQIAAPATVPVATSFLGCQMDPQPEKFKLTPAMEVADEADGVLDMFFGSSQNSDQTPEVER